MPRLFTALDLPSRSVDALRTFRKDADLPVTARWTPADNYHITLRFIGEVDDEQADSIERALTAVHPPSFQVVPLGVGVLPSRRKPRVLTVRIEPTESLRALYEALQNALAAADVPPEERTFRPHITLARLQDIQPERLYAALQELEDGPSLTPFSADEYLLYESALTPEGAMHTIRSRFPLAA